MFVEDISMLADTTMVKLKVGKLHPFLDKDIDILINAVNSGKTLIDCELSELLADINQCESCRLIDGQTAKQLRDYYINGGWKRNG